MANPRIDLDPVSPEVEAEEAKLDKNNELLIPANGNCLYTSIFIGYLLPVINEPAQFNARLTRLVGPEAEEWAAVFRQDLLQHLQNIEYLQSENFQQQIRQFKKKAGLEKSGWGGVPEINILSQYLKISIQEMVHNNEGPIDQPYTFIDLVESKESQNETSEVIYILRCNSDPNEAIEATADDLLQVAQIESAADNKNLQHYRIVSPISLAPAIIPPAAPLESSSDEEESDEEEKNDPAEHEQKAQPLNIVKEELEKLRDALTLGMAAKFHLLFKKAFNPTDVGVAKESEDDPLNIQAGLQLVMGHLNGNPLFARAEDFVKGTVSPNRELTTDEYNTFIQILVRVGMAHRPQYFSDLIKSENIDEDLITNISVQFFREFFHDGALDAWIIEVKRRVSTTLTEAQQAVLNEKLDVIVKYLKFYTSEDAKDPIKRPLFRYVAPAEIERAFFLQDWLQKNLQHPDYPAYQKEFSVLDDALKASMLRVVIDVGVFLFEFIKCLQPNTDIKKIANMETWKKKKKSLDRKKFEKYLAKEFLKQNVFEPNKLRSFWEEIYRHGYGEVCYEMVNESYQGAFRGSIPHQQVQTLWALANLDTIHATPQDARTRMPMASGDGVKGPNFGYDMPHSDAYKKWLDNSLTRVCGDIIMDAFHSVVDLGETLDIPVFLQRLNLFLSDDKKIFRDFVKHRHLYDDSLATFIHFMLENIYGAPYERKEGNTLLQAVLKAAGTKEAFLTHGEVVLKEFQQFAKDMKKHRPNGDPLTKEDMLKGIVFGIGFNGPSFDAPSHEVSARDEIWISFARAGRSAAGKLFVTWIKELAYKSHDIKGAHFPNPQDLWDNFDKFRTLIENVINTKIAIFEETPSLRLQRDSRIWAEGECAQLKSFKMELQGIRRPENFSLPFQQWLLDSTHWYCMPTTIPICIPEEVPVAEYATQDEARQLIFDAVVGISFSENHPQLMPGLFLHWKDELVRGVSAISSAKTLDEFKGEDRRMVLSLIDNLVYKIHPHLKDFWSPVIDEEFRKFMRDDPEVKSAEQKLKAKIARVDSLQKKVDGATPEVAVKISPVLAEAKKEMQLAQAEINRFPKKPTELSRKKYIEFKNIFFQNRDVAQCVEPVFMRVVGHDRFFPVFISKKVGGTNIRKSDGVTSIPLQLGSRIPQDVIPPCNKRCQHHALGHVYAGDMLSYQSADRLDEIRRTHGLGEVPPRYTTFNRISRRLAHNMPGFLGYSQTPANFFKVSFSSSAAPFSGPAEAPAAASSAERKNSYP